MIGNFYVIEYVPNKLVYVYDVDEIEIKFLIFMNEHGNGLKAIKHSVSVKCKSDFGKPKKCFTPIPQIQQLINESLK